MKKATCNNLGGACDEVITGEKDDALEEAESVIKTLPVSFNEVIFVTVKTVTSKILFKT